MARRNKSRVIREPVCVSSREKRSLCRHCRFNPLTPVRVDLVVVELLDADAQMCVVQPDHQLGREVGRVRQVDSGEPAGYVCSSCVDQLPFVPDPPSQDAATARLPLGRFGWVDRPATLKGRPRRRSA